MEDDSMRLTLPRANGALACAILFAGTVASAGQQIKELGLPDEDVRDRIHESFVGGNLAFPAASVLRAIPEARRGDVVRAAGAAAKMYVMSDAFKTRYARELAEGRGGMKTPAPPRTWADFLKQTQTEADRALAELRKGMGNMTPEQRATVEAPILEGMKEMREATPEQRSSWEAQDKERFQNESEEYKKALAEGRVLPPNPDDLIKLRLRQFIARETGRRFLWNLLRSHSLIPSA